MAEKTSGLIRSVATRLRRYVNDHRVLKRGARFEARLPLIVTVLDTGKNSARSLPDVPALVGHTRDISETGLTLLLPSMRVGDAYLTNVESRLEVKLELPSGPVTMLATSVRFEQLSEKEAGYGYLLAVRIIKMQEAEGDRYVAYLKSIKSKKRRVSERRQVHAELPTGPDNAAQPGTWEALTPASINAAFEQFLRE